MTQSWHPFVGRDLGWLLDTHAQARPEHPFLVWEPFDGSRQVWSYLQFRQDALRIATGLIKKGVGAGDRVLIHMDNCPEFLLAWFALGYIGAAGVLTNTRSVETEIRYFAEHADIAGALTQNHLLEPVQSAVKDSQRWVMSTGSSEWEQLADHPPFLGRTRDSLSPLSIQFTSGTTSRPKAVVWTHANALFAGKAGAAHQGLEQDDVHLVYLPLFHTNALSYSVLTSLWKGATFVLQPRFSASRFWDVSVRNGCTLTSMVPFCRRALSTLPVPTHQYRQWTTAVCSPPGDDYFKVKTIGWWGMTETVSHGTVGDLHFPNPSMSIGRAATEYELAVVDDEGKAVAVGETGSLLVRGIRGVTLFAEYLNDQAATDAAFTPDGWFKTGDRVRTSDSGYLYFADREKDMLKVGGENVAASEVESVIMGVSGVREVAVVGKPHPMLDEVVAAFLVLEPNAGEDAIERVVEHCQSNLADFKVPKDLRIVTELPRATLNKVAKAELRKLLQADQG